MRFFGFFGILDATTIIGVIPLHLYIPPDAKSIIMNEVPHTIRSKFVPCVQLGYKIATASLKQVDFLDWDLGEDHMGYLRRIAVHYAFKKAVDEGDIPFTYSYEYNRTGSHRFMVLHTKAAKITLSQVKDKYSIARHAFYRDKLQVANQIFMVADENAVAQIRDNPEYYLLLTYNSGGEEPLFINLGMPNEKGWIDKINLLAEPRVVSNNKPDDEEIISPEQLVGFRKYIQEVEESGN